MKKTLTTFAMLAVCASFLNAQHRQQDGNNQSMLTFPAVSIRTEIILPEVNGYKVFKADLHVHTFFSDGNISPATRIFEAWQDGLDIVAITDHIEYRPNEALMRQFLSEESNGKQASKDKILSDLNVSDKAAEKQARNMGITLIPGAEITREAKQIGHFNALFTTDNNLIHDPDPLQAIRNAKKQGAIVQSNHPGWIRTDNQFTDVAKAALAEGLIDGVEVFNGAEFYPDVIERGVGMGLYICGNTDIHSTSYDKYGEFGHFRNMTFILSKDASLGSVRDALEQRRTLAYSFGDIAGDESLLKAFFLASFDFKYICTDEKGVNHIQITNNTSLPFVLNVPGRGIDGTVPAHASFIWKSKDKVLPITVKSMWYGVDKHPCVELRITPGVGIEPVI